MSTATTVPRLDDPADTDRTGRLRTVLRANTLLSTTTGAVALVAAEPVADLLGVDQVWLVRLLGVGLLGFAAAVYAVSRARTPTLRRWSLFVSLADFGWVLGTVAVIAAGWLSTSGALTMSLIGLFVFTLGILQLRARPDIG